MANVEVLRLDASDEVRVNVNRAAVAAIEVAGTDLVLRLKDGRVLVVQDFALQAMVGKPTVVFADGVKSTGAEMLSAVASINPTEKSVQLASPKLVSPSGTSPSDASQPTDKRKLEPEASGAKAQESTSSSTIQAAQALTSTAPTVTNLSQVVNSTTAQSQVLAAITQPTAEAKSVAAPTTKVSDTADRALFIPPSAPTINVIAADDKINLAEASATGGVLVTGGGVSNAIVALTIKGSAGTVTKSGAVVDGAWSVALSQSEIASLGQGAVAVSATQAYAGGVASPSSTRDISVDTVRPDAAVFDKVAGTDLVNAAAAKRGVTVGGVSSDQQGLVELQVVASNGAKLSKTVAIVSGRWAVTLTADEVATFGEGTVVATAKVSDLAGNVSDASSHTFAVDTVPPATPKLDPVTSDNVVNAPERAAGVSVTGTAEPGATVTLSLLSSSGQVTLTAVVDASGRWAASLPADAIDKLGQGVVSMNLQATDPAGNLSDVASSTFDIDTIGPRAPVMAAIADDNVINAAEAAAGVSVQGLAEVGARVLVTVTSSTGQSVTLSSEVVGADASWHVRLSAEQLGTLGDGQLTVVATAVDAAGNPGERATVSATLDTTPPPAPTVSGWPVDDFLNATEMAGGLFFTGTAADADKVVVLLEGTSSTVRREFFVHPVAGEWTAQLSPAELRALGEGTVKLSVLAADTAGNTSRPAVAPDFVIDTVAPLQPAIDAVTGDDKVSAADVAQGVVIRGTALAAEGVPQRGGVLRLDITRLVAQGSAETESTARIEVPVDADGNWSADLLGTLRAMGDGEFVLRGVLLDPAGNASGATQRSFVFDVNPPSAPLVTEVAGDGLVGKPETLNGFAVRGTGEVDSNVFVTVSGPGLNYQTTGRVNERGEWSVAVPSSLSQGISEGSFNVVAYAEDAVGNRSGVGRATFQVDLTPPATPQIDRVTDDNIVSDAEASHPVTIRGTSEPDAEVKIVVVGADGTTKTVELPSVTGTTWAADFDLSQFGSGLATVTVIQTDKAGNVSNAGVHQFLIDKQGPDAISLPDYGADAYLNGLEARDESFVISGKAEAGATVRVTLQGQQGTVQREGVVAQSDGSWALAGLTQAEVATLGQGAVTVSITSTDAAGNPSTAVQPNYSFTIDTVAPANPVTFEDVTGDDLVSSAEWRAETANLLILGAADAGDLVQVRIVNKADTSRAMTLTATADATTGLWSVAVPRASAAISLAVAGSLEGEYSVVAVHYDAAGNASPIASHDFTVDQGVSLISLQEVAGRTINATSGAFGITMADANAGTVQFTGRVEAGSQSVQISFTSGLSSFTRTILRGQTNAYGDTLDENGLFVAHLAKEDAASGQSIVALDTWYDPVRQELRSREDTLSVGLTVTDAAGNVGSQAYKVYLDRVPPLPPTLNNFSDPGPLADGKINIVDSTGGALTFSGTGEPNSIVQLRFYRQGSTDAFFTIDTPVGANSSGTLASLIPWSYRLTSADLASIGQGQFTVQAVGTDNAGNVSPAGNSLSFAVDTVAPVPVLPAAGNEQIADDVLNIADLTTGDQQLSLVVKNSTDAASTDRLTVTVADANDASKVITFTNVSSSGTDGWNLSIPTSQLRTVFGNAAQTTLRISVSVTDAFGNVSDVDATTAGNQPLTRDVVLDLRPPVVQNQTAPAWVNIEKQAAVDAGTATFDITGTTEKNASVTLTLTSTAPGASTVTLTDVLAGSDGTWTASLDKNALARLYPAGTADNATVTVVTTVEDSAGNPGTGATTTFQIDLHRPIPATVDGGRVDIGAADLAAGKVIGGGPGSASPDATISISFQFGSQVTEVASGIAVAQDGSWSFRLTDQQLSGLSGSGHILLYAEDAAGNKAATPASIDLEIDTLAPQLTLDALTADGVLNLAETASGYVLTGTYDGALQAGRLAVVLAGTGGQLGTLQSPTLFAQLTPTDATDAKSGGTWSLTLTQAQVRSLGTGDVQVKFVATDLAGNVSDTTDAAAKHFTTDFILPPTPVSTTAAGVLVVDAAEAQSGITITGTAEANARLEFDLGGLTLPAQQLTHNGTNWSLTLSTAQISQLVAAGQEGAFTLNVTATDPAGNKQSQALSLSGYIDRALPDATSGLAAGDGYLNLAERYTNGLALSGTIEVARNGTSSVEITVTNPSKLNAQGVLLDASGRVTLPLSAAGAGGAWAATLSTTQLASLLGGTAYAIPDKLSVSVVTVDSAGNRSATASTLDVLVDLVRPGITTVARTGTDGHVDTDNTTQLFNAADATSGAGGHPVTYQFTVDEAASQVNVTLFRTGGASYSYAAQVVAGSGGKEWTVTLSAAHIAALGDGAANMRVVATDVAGNPQAPVTNIPIVIDRTSPTAPVLTLPASASDSKLNYSEVKDDGLLLSGTAEANATVTVVVASSAGGTGLTYTVQAGANGSWSKQLTYANDLDPSLGKLNQADIVGGATLTFTATATDRAGNVSPATTRGSIVIDTIGPLPPADIAGVASGQVYNQAAIAGTPTLQGTAVASSPVVLEFRSLTDSGKVVTFTTTSDASGAWSYTPQAAGWQSLNNDSFDVHVYVKDDQGNPSQHVVLTDVRVDNTAPTAEVLTMPGLLTDGFLNLAEALSGFTLSARPTESSGAKVKVELVVGDIVDANGNITTPGTTVVGKPELTNQGSSANWTVSFAPTDITAAMDGKQAHIRVTETDAAGNSTVTNGAVFTIDLTAPAAPVAATLAGLNASGGSNYFNISSSTGGLTVTPPATGVEAGGQLTYQLVAVDAATGNVTYAGATRSLTVNAQGAYSANSVNFARADVDALIAGLNASATQTASNVMLRATWTDAAGNVSSTADSSPFRVDLLAPTAGLSTTGLDGWISINEKANGITLSGQASEAGSVVVDVVERGTTDVLKTTTATFNAATFDWSALVDLSSVAVNGKTYNFLVRTTDGAGNTSTFTYAGSDGLGVTADLQAPAAPSVSSSGAYLANAVAAPTPVRLFQLANASSNPVGGTVTAELFVDADGDGTYDLGEVSTGLTRSAVIQSDKSWSISIDPTVFKSAVPADGNYVWRVTTTDLAGNTSSQFASAANQFASVRQVVDTAIPRNPDGTKIALNLGSAPALTLNLQNTLNGWGPSSGTDALSEVGSVRVFVTSAGVTSLDSNWVVANADGSWSLSSFFSQAALRTFDGRSTFVTVFYKDTAGNAAATNFSQQLTVDLTAPTVASLGAFNNLTSTGNVGAALNGYLNAVSFVNGVRLSGTSPETATGSMVRVEFWDASGNTLLSSLTRTVSSAADGSWATSLTNTELASISGQTTVKVWSIDKAGNVSATAATQTLVVDTVSSLSGVAVSGGSDGVINIAEAAAGLTVTGSAEAGATVTMELLQGTSTKSTATATLGSTTSLSGLAFSSATLAGLADGVYTLKVTSTDAAGNVSTPSQTSLTLDRTRPAVTLNSVASDGTVNIAEATAGVTLSGTFSEALASGLGVVLMRNGNAVLGSDAAPLTATVNGSTWSLGLTSSQLNGLGTGGVTVKFIGNDVAGNAIDPTATSSFTIDITAPANATSASFAGSDSLINASSSLGSEVLTFTKATGNADAVSVDYILTGTNGTVTGNKVFSGSTAQAQLSGTLTGTSAADDVNILGQGAVSVQYRTVDAAGNVSSFTTVPGAFVIDTQAPVVQAPGATHTQALKVSVASNGRTLLTSDALSAVDNLSAADTVEYSVNLSSTGGFQIWKSGSQLTGTNAKFTQADINSGLVEVRYTGSGNASLSLALTVRDGAGNTGTANLGLNGLSNAALTDAGLLDPVMLLSNLYTSTRQWNNTVDSGTKINTELWLDASDVDAIRATGQSNGSTVLSWLDKAGGAKLFSSRGATATLSAKDANGMTWVNFGTDPNNPVYFEQATPTGWRGQSVYFVANMPTLSGGAYYEPLGLKGAGGLVSDLNTANIGVPTGSPIALGNAEPGRAAGQSTAFVNGTGNTVTTAASQMPYLINTNMVVFADAQTSVSANGSLFTRIGYFSGGTLQIGSGTKAASSGSQIVDGVMLGYASEYFVFDYDLSAADSATLQSYLANKWQTSLTNLTASWWQTGNLQVAGNGGETLTGWDKVSGAGVANGNYADDMLVGGTGNDTLRGGTGTDYLMGGAGNDVLDGGAGADVIDGGAGVNWLRFDSAGHGIKVDLSASNTNRLYGYVQIADDGSGASSATGAQDLVKNVNHIAGTQYNDVIVGTDVTTGAFENSGANIIRGGDGSDVLDGAGGVDSYDASGGALGAVIDMTQTALAAGAKSPDNVDVAGFITVTDSFGKTDYIKGFESIVGGSGNDRITVSQAQFTASGASFDGGAGTDVLSITGVSTLNLDTLLANAGSKLNNIEYLRLSDGASGSNFTVSASTLQSLYAKNPGLVIQLDSGDTLRIDSTTYTDAGGDRTLTTVTTADNVVHNVRVDYPSWAQP